MAKGTRKLKLPSGTDQVYVGEATYTANPEDHTVEVPEEAAPTLIETAGAIDADVQPVPPPDGHVWMTHPDKGASCSVGGASYTMDESGFVSVPSAYWSELAAHGFTLADRG